MLAEILKKVMSKQIKRNLMFSGETNFFSEIRIMDSSEFVVSKKVADSFPGYGGKGREAIAQVQFEYEILGGTVTQLSLGCGLDSDVAAGANEIDKVPSKALLIRDLGYFSPKTFKDLSSRDIYFISRAKTQWNYYVMEDGKEKLLTTQDIIDKLKKQKEKYLDIKVFAGRGAKTPVRLIANLLTEEQKLNRLKKKKDKLGKLGKDVLEGAGLNLFVTNIETEKCEASAVYQLYTLRWQIELIFKTWKSILKLHKIHPMNAIRLECVILVRFLWIMLNWSVLKLLQEETKKEISLHKFTHTIMSRRIMINATILQDKNLLFEWIYKLLEISIKFHKKEYKKGSIKQEEVLSKCFYKTT
jgi:hypothetical protein